MQSGKAAAQNNDPSFLPCSHEFLRWSAHQSKLRDLTKHLDRSVRICEFLEKLRVVLQSLNGVRKQPVQPAGGFRLGLRHVPDAHLEVFPVGVHGPDHNLVTEHKSQIDAIGRYLNHAIAAGHARQHQYTVFAERLHAVENYGGISRSFKYQIEWTELLSTLDNRDFLRDYVACTHGLDEFGIEIWLRIASKRRDLDPAQAQRESRQQPDRACPHHGGSSRSPYFQSALDLIGLMNAFFHDRERFEQHSCALQTLRHLHDEVGIIHVILR